MSNPYAAVVGPFTPIEDLAPAERSVENLRTDVENLSAAVGVLAKRLQPVLGPTGDASSDGERLASVSQPASQHVETLRGIADQVLSINAVVDGLLRRLEF